jgi:hypothetical protein
MQPRRHGPTLSVITVPSASSPGPDPVIYRGTCGSMAGSGPGHDVAAWCHHFNIAYSVCIDPGPTINATEAAMTSVNATTSHA